MVIVEENKAYSAILGSERTPYLARVAAVHGQATNMVANYPVSCPSLAAYIIMTSGSRHGICDDRSPAYHPLPVDNVFRQVASAGKVWKAYSESMTSNCQRVDGPPGGFLVRHSPPAYYTSENGRCLTQSVPMGTTTSGSLHTDLAHGLPDYSFVTPNACHDMHGATTCPINSVQSGDAWLAHWLPQIASSPDYLRSQLVVVITWDEGSQTDNHIPTLLVGHTVLYSRSSANYTHCSTLRLAEEVLRLPFLSCAASAPSFRVGLRF